MPETKVCPDCGSEMVLRNGRNGQFWGCKSFPRCRHTENYRRETTARTASQPAPAFTPSRYQEAIFEFVKAGHGNAIVEAVAGSGKTTTLVHALEFTDPTLTVGFVAFNKSIATELQARAPSYVHASTLHSLGYRNIRAIYPRVRIEDRKVEYIVRAIAQAMRPEDGDIVLEQKRDICRLVSLIKATLSETDDTSLEALCDRYDIDTNGDSDLFFTVARQALERNDADTSTIDFDDMIRWCAIGKVPCTKFHLLMVDETQDLNASQLLFVRNSLKPGGRIIAVGDRWQSIYGFRGADVSAIPNMIDVLGATVLPLSISYRCPRAVVEFSHALVPTIEAAPNAIDGTVEYTTIHSFRPQDGDFVLCRRNAPLVAQAYKLLAQGVKVCVLGRDIASGLVTLIDKACRKGHVHNGNIIEFARALHEYVNAEIAKFEAQDKPFKAASLADKAEVLDILMDGIETVSELKARIDTIFSEEQRGITFATVHKAKGLESKTVWILKPEELGSFSKCKTEEDRQQELNIAYVAYTRAKENLYLVEG